MTDPTAPPPLSWADLSHRLQADHAARPADRNSVIVPVPPGAGVVVRADQVLGRACAIVLAPVGHAARADLGRTLELAKDLEVGCVIIVDGTVALRHLVPLARAGALAEILDAIGCLARDAALLGQAVIRRSAPPGAAALAFSNYAD